MLLQGDQNIFSSEPIFLPSFFLLIRFNLKIIIKSSYNKVNVGVVIKPVIFQNSFLLTFDLFP